MLIGATEHTTRAFDADLQELTCMTAAMGGHAERQISEAVRALTTHHPEHARTIVSADAMLDMQQRDIERKAIATIAVRQPMAVDLRQIIGVLRIAHDLERIGDLAKNIGKRVLTFNGRTMPPRTLRGLKHMTELVLDQLRQVLDAFAERDSRKAIEVWYRDETIDSMYSSLFREFLTSMMADPETVTVGIHLVFCAKNIERIGDHATNIAEMVNYMVEGRMLSDERPKADSTCTMTVVFNSGPLSPDQTAELPLYPSEAREESSNPPDLTASQLLA